MEKYNFRINEIELKNGQKIIPNKINIIVGPNNAGKSRILKDIKLLLNSSISKDNLVIVKNMKYELPKDKESFIESYKIKEKVYKVSAYQVNLKTFSGIKDIENGLYDNGVNQYESDSNSINSNWEEELDGYINNINKDSTSNSGLVKEITETTKLIRNNADGTQTILEEGTGGTTEPVDYSESVNNFMREYGKCFFSYLGTEEKLMLCKRQMNYGMQSYQTNFLSDNKKETLTLRELSKLVKNMFNKDIILDTFTLGQEIAFRVGEDFDEFRRQRRDNNDKDRELFNYPLLDEEGDGLKNFVTTFLTLKSTDKNIILLDEPESFLHPPLARRLGETIAKSASDDKQIFIATHSEDIINGIIAKTSDVNIIRITRAGDINNIEKIESDEVKKVTKNPVLVASNILKGLFSEKVYITESFADTLIYQQIVTKVDEFSSMYFVNTQGKDKIADAIKFYDSLKVNNIAIYDFDYFRKKDTIKKSLYHKIGDCKDYDSVIEFRVNLDKYINDLVKTEMKAENKTEAQLGKEEYKKELKTRVADYYHSKGIDCLDEELKTRAKDVLEILKRNNIIVLKGGCLERTLEDAGLEYTQNKNTWLEEAIKVIEKMSPSEIDKLEIYNELFKI